MRKNNKRAPVRTLVLASAAVALLVGLPTALAYFQTKGKTFLIQDAPAAPAAIVFGAGLNRNGTPTTVLRDRINTAADLYFAGKVKKLLMSGDNRTLDYNEPGAMKAYALQLGIPEEDITLDYAGRRTYDTCYRAAHIFGVTDALIVTQAYHLPRAMITCRGVGVNAYGVFADQRSYAARSMISWRLREIPATLVAYWDVFISRPLPVLGKPEPIFETSNRNEP